MSRPHLDYAVTFQKDNVGIGKRKKASATVFLFQGSGNITINKIPGELYFQYNSDYLLNLRAPLRILNVENDVDIIAFVKGGGLTGQADAIQLGLARLICKKNKDMRTILKPYGLLTRDARIKERKKYGLRKARKAPQYSKR
tara:strand:- start:12016 stop:12441 length:426 start_codon:yes stop_codon:yes gene_type:complete